MTHSSWFFPLVTAFFAGAFFLHLRQFSRPAHKAIPPDLDPVPLPHLGQRLLSNPTQSSIPFNSRNPQRNHRNDLPGAPPRESRPGRAYRSQR